MRATRLTLKRADGERLRVIVSARVLSDRAGAFRGTVALFTDVTDEENAQESARRMNEELNAMFDAYPDMSFRLSSDGTILDHRVGVAGEAALFVPPAVFRNRCVYDVLPPEIGESLRRAIDEVKRTHSPVTIEYNGPPPRENEFWEARLSPLPHGEILVLVRDITERKRAEEKLARSEQLYRTVLESMNDGVVIADENDILTYVNPRLCEMSGYSAGGVAGASRDCLLLRRGKPAVAHNGACAATAVGSARYTLA